MGCKLTTMPIRKFNACAHLKYFMATIESCATCEMDTMHESIIYDLIFRIYCEIKSMNCRL
jgi:hypothetical protein